MEKCIFCRIAEKEINSSIIYENEAVISFLDINPSAEGHSLVIPKKHYKEIFDMPSSELKEVISACKVVGELLKDKLGASGINLLHASGKDAQQSVFHFHMHILPRFKGDNIDAFPKTNKKVDVSAVYKKLGL